jgi:hypothetical protein
MNKLTLKSLKQELENMKLKSGSSKVKKSNESIPTKGVVGHDIKNSYVNRLYMKSGALWLYLITGIISYGHKIPYIGRIISIIAAMYARTTIMKILTKVRKIFIIFNALIGVYLVFKSVGFSTDNILVGFVAVGETYLQTLLSFTSKLFHWFVELFDHKIIPNVPGDNGGTWFSKPKIIEPKYKSLIIPSNLKIPDFIESPGFSLRELYKNSTPVTKSWFSYITDSNTLWWIAVSVGTIGFIYLGYNFCTNPHFVEDFFIKKPRTNIQPPTPPIDPGNNPDITLTGAVADFLNSSRRKFINVYSSTVNALNPFNYFVTSSELQSQINLFMDIQNDINRSNRRLFPFTENNPFDPWYKKLRLQFFGESGKEFVYRTQLIDQADSVYHALKIDKGKSIEFSSTIFSTPNSAWNSPGVLSPIATTIGLNPNALDAFNSAAVAITEQKLSSIPSSPMGGLSKVWEISDTVDQLERRLQEVKNPLPSTSNNPTILELDSPTTTPPLGSNRFSILES